MHLDKVMKRAITFKLWLVLSTLHFLTGMQLCIGLDKVFSKFFMQSPEKFGLKLVYDVTHNIAKIENHKIDGGEKKVWVHRKGATRAFPPGHPDIPTDYRSEGQPVLIPGSMGTSSWVLAGSQKAMELTFGSTAHGAGRMMSRSAAKRQYWGADIKAGLGENAASLFAQLALRFWLKKQTPPTKTLTSSLKLVIKLESLLKLHGLFH